MISSKKVATGLVATLVLTFALVWGHWVTTPVEPRYRNSLYSEWLDQIQTTYSHGQRTLTYPSDTGVAIRAIGSNGIPFLVEEISARDGWLKQRISHICPEMRSRWESVPKRRRRALIGFLSLRPEHRQVAIPLLIERLREPNPSPFVAEVLGWYGNVATSAIPVLVERVSSQDTNISRVARWAVARITAVEAKDSEHNPTGIEGHR